MSNIIHYILVATPLEALEVGGGKVTNPTIVNSSFYMKKIGVGNLFLGMIFRRREVVVYPKNSF